MVQGSPAPAAEPVWQAELFERAMREGIAAKTRALPSAAPKAPPQSTVVPAPSPANSLSADSTGHQAAPPPSHSGRGAGQPPRGRELGPAFGKTPTGGGAAGTSAPLPQPLSGAPSETLPSPVVPLNPSPATPEPLPPAGGGSTSSTGSKSAGLSSIFRVGSARVGSPLSGAPPRLVGPSAAGSEPASGVSVPIPSPPSVPAADLPAIPPSETPSPEHAPGTLAPAAGIPEPPKKTTGGISSIFRRDRPTL